MPASLSVDPRAADPAHPRTDASRISVARAALALVWAAALIVAVGDAVPTTTSDVPFVAAALLALYPAIDVVASLARAAHTPSIARVLRVNAAIGAVAVVAIGAAAFGSDAGATLAAFGIWAAVSGALQLAVAVGRRRIDGRQPALLISGGLSTIAGLSFLASSGKDDANLAGLGGYMALGAVLFLISAYTGRNRTRTA